MTRQTRQRTVFSVPRMDCPSEEKLIRMALEDLPDVTLSFDLVGRQLTAIHPGPAAAVLERLTPLGLGAQQVVSEPADALDQVPQHVDDAAEAVTLRIVLAINALMFVVELAFGLIAESTGLVADSLDMFADAAVYGVALYAVGRAAAMQRTAARLAGWLQLLLALGALAEVGRRFLFGSEPVSMLMMAVGLLALIANTACLLLIGRQRDRGAHMKASYIFSANDVLANLGVILAGTLVALTGSAYPDLVIGAVIGLLVLNGARRILALR
jgi:Co/Zn/Cd efflux system component